MKFLLILFLLPLRLLAQDITGVWTGTLYNDTTKQYLRYELAVSEYDGKLSGYSHTIFVVDSVENVGVKSIKIKKSGEEYLLEDDKLIYNNYTAPPAKGVRTYSHLELSETDSEMVLKGFWKTNATRNYRSITGNIYLKKKKKIEETLIIPKLEKLGVAKSLSFMPYDNYAKDMTVTNSRPVDNRLADIKQPTNGENSTPLKTNIDLNSSGKKARESAVKPVSIDTQQVATANTSALNPAPNKIPGMDKAEIKGDKKQVSDIMNSKITSAGDPNIQQNKNIVNETSGYKKIDTISSSGQVAISKNELSNNINKTINKSVQDSSITTEPVITRKVLTKVSSINPEIDNLEMKGKKEQINPVKTLVSNAETIKAAINSIPKAAADISSRQIETVQSVDIKNDSLLLTLYDNGEIDGDTVSILLNGKVIMPMQGLTAQGITKTIYLTPEMGDSISLIMYAENLGSIPPNTGLLIVYDGTTRHEIRFSGDLQKNSAIILKRRKSH